MNESAVDIGGRRSRHIVIRHETLRHTLMTLVRDTRLSALHVLRDGQWWRQHQVTTPDRWQRLMSQNIHYERCHLPGHMARWATPTHSPSVCYGIWRRLRAIIVEESDAEAVER